MSAELAVNDVGVGKRSRGFNETVPENSIVSSTWMTIAHIVRKDLRQTRWWWCGYVAIIAAATYLAMQTGRAGTGWDQMLARLAWIVGGIIASLVVQSDSPTNSRAFWASRPIDARVLLAAKFIVAIGMSVGIALIGQLAVFARFPMRDGQISEILVTGVWIYSAWLLHCMLVGAITTRIGSTLAIVIATLAAYAFATSAFDSPLRGIRDLASGDTWGMIATIGALALIIAVYQVRVTNRRWVAAAIAMLSTGVLAITAPRAPATVANRIFSEPTRMRLLIDSVDDDGPGSFWLQTIAFSIAGMDTRYRHRFVADTVLLTGRNGVTVPNRFYGATHFAAAAFRRDDVSPANDSASVGRVSLPIELSLREQLGGSLTALSVRGSVQVTNPVVIATLPAFADSVVSVPGYQLRWRQILRGYGFSALDVVNYQNARQANDDASDAFSQHGVRLVWAGSSDTAYMRAANTTWTEKVSVLPGATTVTLHVSMALPDLTLSGNALPPIEGARVELIQWQTVARHRLSASTTIPVKSAATTPGDATPASARAVVPYIETRR